MFDTIHPLSWQFFLHLSIDKFLPIFGPATLFIDDVFYGRPIIINQFDGKILDWKSGFCLRIRLAYWIYVYIICFPFHSVVLTLNYQIRNPILHINFIWRVFARTGSAITVHSFPESHLVSLSQKLFRNINILMKGSG